MNTAASIIWLCLAMAFGFTSGYYLWGMMAWIIRRSRYRHTITHHASETIRHARKVNRGYAAAEFDQFVLAFVSFVSKKSDNKPFFFRKKTASSQRRRFDQIIERSGLQGRVTSEGVIHSRLHLALIGAVSGLCLGACFSFEMSGILLFVGLVGGWVLLPRTLKRCCDKRAGEMERHLPEMLDVISLGLRSGMTFDRSIELFANHFQITLAQEFDLARHQWVHGLTTRDEALRKLASSYESAILSRVIESIVRSLHFGSSMVECLESAARDARTSYRTKKQEMVAKAPVKIMVPTGALILPAMLLLVLGPVLLELSDGFL